MTALICGSIAYDIIMVFDDRFQNHILADKVHMLNVCFVVPKLRREFGGCAGNVAYNLNLLGGEGHILATVGKDFGPYAVWLEQQGIGREYIAEVEGYTAQAYITSDLEDNQITAFHPGAMDLSHTLSVPTDAGISIGIISPDGPDGMRLHGRQFADSAIPYIFDPGQATTRFQGHELLQLIEQATWVTVNDYECEMIQKGTGLSAGRISERVDALIVTLGAQGSYIMAGGKRIDIPAAEAGQVVDPTGCGDAYRAGLLFGLMNDMDWETTGRIASLAGAYKIEQAGTQNHRFTIDQFKDRFQEQFGYRF